MLAVSQYLCTSAEISGDTTVTNMSSTFPVEFIWQVGTGIYKTPYLRFISAYMHTNMGSLLALSLTSALPLQSNPQHERESDIHAIADQLPTSVQLIDVYPDWRTHVRGPGFPQP